MPVNNSSRSNSTVQGLNLVYPPTEDSDSKDLLTSPSDYPDFTAQLDLWTNLSFASDEPAFIDDTSRDSLDFRNSSVPQLDMDKDPQSVLITAPDKLPSSLHLDAPPSSTTTTTSLVPSSNFDISSFLAGFGIDPFLVPPQPSSPQFSSNPITNIPHTEAETQRVSKRPRARKSSVTSATTPIIARPTPSTSVPTAQGGGAGSPSDTGSASVTRGRAVSEGSEDPGVALLSATEDKRRRNTAASARFRAKKKEREQAMEKRSKELESRVNELERECEGLRRENGWLKGLVVGVTSGNPVPISTAVDEPSSSSSPASTANAILSQEAVKKRKRESLND
ncbi:hypothetical protein Clacol_000569 [Clathrus columnatus]|uniref:BZIP domain-containing protein n=1 Tax=Clathrus columnatus TaxID=1419009 RepID=A0AAV4ZYU2_9AGAM|nr:hypothetical protein Clacol_000569 [Clathrus columnatus]